jgi:hypothetical protein
VLSLITNTGDNHFTAIHYMVVVWIMIPCSLVTSTKVGRNTLPQCLPPLTKQAVQSSETSVRVHHTTKPDDRRSHNDFFSPSNHKISQYFAMRLASLYWYRCTLVNVYLKVQMSYSRLKVHSSSLTWSHTYVIRGDHWFECDAFP